jgi:glucosamine--fructose-6-phosphate aminotransferase (isomerizing)
MCGIFGIISKQKINQNDLKFLSSHARQRGRDSSGLVHYTQNKYIIKRADYDIKRLVSKNNIDSTFVLGHSRLITNGLHDNQPVVREGCFLIHNGIIVNSEEIWKRIDSKPKFQIDSEVILGVALNHIEKGLDIGELPNTILSLCKGTIACALAIPHKSKLLLFSNNGSLYVGEKESATYFSSERYPLVELGCEQVKQIWKDAVIIEIPAANKLDVSDDLRRTENLIPAINKILVEEEMLKYEIHNLKRCSKCILPVTMPFISFDENGVCNYCNNYKLLNIAKPKDTLFKLVEPYRRNNGADCIVPFSGGRDSSYGLHLIVNELKMKPITYSYDWGMVTDLARRNISRMCSELGVENIIIAADISEKRRNIAMNLKAWLKSPHLGMLNILMAGDKHFFKYIDTVKNQTGIDLNLWGFNPLEVTHFKAGFLGIEPNFEENNVYMRNAGKQFTYQFLRFKAMFNSPGYFNHSLWDTLSGEYYRSFSKKKDYYHIFDYWQWDEKIVDDTLKQYDWELAPDTSTSWRIGDGTAGFYNYIYYSMAGLTEHDTLRSNQIREGQITREDALRKVEDENRPRYENIRWYLDAIGMDFAEVIGVVNKIPKLY